MKRIALLSLIAASFTVAQAESFTDTARVRSVEPQYERISTPRKECTREVVTETRHIEERRSYGGAVVGGLAGAVIGNQVGKGHGREAATALGAVVGAMTGDRIDNRDRGGYYEEVPREIQRCRTVEDWESRVTGYRVTYDYRGQQYTALMPDNPGKTLRVRVSVDPIE
ncbi:glycine zipper 2TM domain-containing protein [Chitinimonas koreensis]|uniref:glycine zipper 2TM domain-containing protein n=1 Tax=Chitinimonas koreensis TaxID=356302 RepID=UPI0004168E10|nr:glycine zipper 2TM domain-containing protein [Chitinimonas koreensis]QNM95825.1 glycine zipper 2TM domain-containing protein [Chitinimonas koreensis]